MPKKKQTTKKGTTAKSSSAPKTTKTAAEISARNQVTAIVLFTVSLFLLFVVLIKGEAGNFWNTLHTFFYSMFGVLSVIFPILLGTLSILLALDKLTGSVKAKIVATILLTFLLSSAYDVLFFESKYVTTYTGYWDYIGLAFDKAISANSPGLFGCMIGRGFYLLFGNPGAAITIILLIFLVLMLITGTTLIKFFKTIHKPVKKIETVAGDVIQQYSNNLSRNKDEDIEIDIPIDEDYEEDTTPKYTSSDKKSKVIETYRAGDESDNIEMTPSKPVLNVKEENVVDGVNNKDDLIEKINDAISKNTEEKPKKITKEEDYPVAEPKEHFEPQYKIPPVSLLSPPTVENKKNINQELEQTATRLVDTLRSFGVETRIINISRGPSVTRYELQPSAGVKISKITNLADDIALNLAAAGVRIEAPIPNKPAVGIEVPNKITSVVNVREIIDSPTFSDANSKITVALGKDISGKVTVTDIAKMPHGLIAGATGSGKSVCVNSIILSILYKASPDEVKLLLIDPKVVELGVYNSIPHLIVPVVTDPRKASGALGWAVLEMERRYKLFAENDVRNLEGYNKLAERDESIVKMPQIVIIIDELADLMMTAPGEVEDSICRIAQKARAAGMHLIIATQRPSVDVVTGLIKANIPTRIAFAVSSQVDSRTIIDSGGAEKLMGRGDMLFFPSGAIKPTRIQGCFVSDEEREKVIDYIKRSYSSTYDEDVINEIERQAAKEKASKSGMAEDREASDSDAMLIPAIEVVVNAGQASTSLLQRKLKLGYARAARIIDEMEERGVVGPYEGSKPRQVLMTKEQFLEMRASSKED